MLCNSKIEMSGFSKVKMSAFRICAVAIFLADGEPYRVCRRVNILRDYPDDKIKIYP